MSGTKSGAELRQMRIRHRQSTISLGVGGIRPSPAMYLSRYVYVGDCQYVDQDESVVQDALKRLTYVHHVDHSPEVDDWAIEELIFRLDHIDEGSGFQQETIERMKGWQALAPDEYIEPLPPLEETWG